MDGILGKIGIFLLCLLLIPAFVGLGGGALIGQSTHSITLVVLWFAFCSFICGIIAKKMDDDYGAVKWSIILCFIIFVWLIAELLFNITDKKIAVLDLLSGSGVHTPEQIIKMWNL